MLWLFRNTHRNIHSMSIRLVIFILIVAIAGSTVLAAFVSAQAVAKDQQRLWDISLIRAALQIYFNENNFYPESDGNGKPLGLNNYLDFWPNSPQANTGCSDSQNQYWYSQKLGGSDYSLTFCLAQDYDGLQAGPQSFSSKGVK